MTKPTQDEFAAQFAKIYAVQRVARELWHARNPGGMGVGMPRVDLPAELVDFLLTRWRAER